MKQATQTPLQRLRRRVRTLRTRNRALTEQLKDGSAGGPVLVEGLPPKKSPTRVTLTEKIFDVVVEHMREEVSAELQPRPNLVPFKRRA